MKALRLKICGAAILVAPFVFADVPPEALTADIVVLGELHNYDAHHETQEVFLRAIAPKAVVYEMLRPEEAAQLEDVERSEAEIRKAASTFHWSNITDYAGLLTLSPEIIGAARAPDEVRRAFSEGAAPVFGSLSATYGLTDALSEEEQSLREQLQFTAHCEAMPLEMMGGMVEAQRFRDAAFARTALEALDRFGPPIVVITGNGHARSDWGIPRFLTRVRPDLAVFSLGQSVDGHVAGSFDFVLDAPRQADEDPCAAFR